MQHMLSIREQTEYDKTNRIYFTVKKLSTKVRYDKRIADYESKMTMRASTHSHLVDTFERQATFLLRCQCGYEYQSATITPLVRTAILTNVNLHFEAVRQYAINQNLTPPIVGARRSQLRFELDQFGVLKYQPPLKDLVSNLEFYKNRRMVNNDLISKQHPEPKLGCLYCNNQIDTLDENELCPSCAAKDAIRMESLK